MEETSRPFRAQKLRLGMVGGGPGAGIAEAHRRGIRIDDNYEFHAGMFSRSPAKSEQMAALLGISTERTYARAEDMARAESRRADGIEVVAIVTPNDSHYAIAKAFLEHGIHVICDKPLTTSSALANDLHELTVRNGLILAVAHNYSCYAMVRHAAQLVRDGRLGEVRIVQAEHASGWAASRVDGEQTAWRFDPDLAGIASVVYDLGTHAHHLLRFVTGLEVDEVSAELNTVVKGRRVYDDAHVNLRLANGARGALWASMAATGQEHGLRIRVFGSEASLEWRHEDPQHLDIRKIDGSRETLAHGQGGLSDGANRFTRVGLGHPEGFLESFANFYSEVADAIRERNITGRYQKPELGFPDVRDGVCGVRFVEAVAESHGRQGAWTLARA